MHGEGPVYVGLACVYHGWFITVGIHGPVHQHVAQAVIRIPVAELGLALHSDKVESPLKGDARRRNVAPNLPLQTFRREGSSEAYLPKPPDEPPSVPIHLFRGQGPSALYDGGLVHGLDIDPEDPHDLSGIGRGGYDTEAPPAEESQRLAVEFLYRMSGAEKCRDPTTLSLVLMIEDSLMRNASLIEGPAGSEYPHHARGLLPAVSQENRRKGNERADLHAQDGVRPDGNVDYQGLRIGFADGLRELPQLRKIGKHGRLQGLATLFKPADRPLLLLDESFPLPVHILPGFPECRDGHDGTLHGFPLIRAHGGY